MREPLLLPTLAVAAGICIGHFFPAPAFPIYILFVAGPLLLAAAFVASSIAWIRLLTVCLAFCIGGLASQTLHRPGRTPHLDVEDGESAILSGCVVKPPVFSPGKEQFTLELGPHAYTRVTVRLQHEQRLKLVYGQQIETPAKIRVPRNFNNPAAFDYASYLARQHIYWNASVASVSDLRIQTGRCGNRAFAWLFGIRTWALERLQSLYADDPHTAALLQATLLGETSGLEKRWTSDFRVTGTYHALVISGQHVAVLALTLLGILRLFQTRRVPALCVATVASWLYAFITGFSSPVVRAAGGFTLYLIASYCYRKTRVLNVLAAIGLLYLLCDPDQLFDPSFQLSFLSAAAIAAFAIPLMERYTEPLREAVKRFDQVPYDAQIEKRAAQWRVELRLVARTLTAWTSLPAERSLWAVEKGARVAAFAAEAVLVSACVQFGLALPMISYFHRLSVTGLSANVIVIPLLSAVVPLGFTCLFTGWHTLAVLTRLLLVAAEAVAGWHVHFEPTARIGDLPVWVAATFAGSLLALAYTVRRHPRGVAAPLIAALSLFVICCVQPWAPDLKAGLLELSAIDVSQGDSLLLAFPNGKTMLVDAGGFPGAERMTRKPQIDMGEDVISPYLWSRKIRHLDYVALSHGHSDHMGGLAAILDNFHPDALWIGAEPETPAWKEIQRQAVDDHVRIEKLTRASAPIRIGDTTVRVLAPAADYVPGDTAENNDSLVFRLNFGKRSILFTGDAERQVEQELLQDDYLEPVTVLKVGHHGSRTSSTEDFIERLSPQFALISDGYKNQFHHPHPTVLERLAQHHATVLRTDEHGLITFLTDGDRVEVKTFR
jgi:competence protein ComEC